MNSQIIKNFPFALFNRKSIKSYILILNPNYKPISSFSKIKPTSIRPKHVQIKRHHPILKEIYMRSKLNFYNVLNKHSRTSRILVRNKTKIASASLKAFIIYLYALTMYYLYTKYKDDISNNTDHIIKNIIIEDVCDNPWIIRKISHEILELCKKERIRQLLRELVIKEIIHSEDIKANLIRIANREIVSYLKTAECKKDLTKLLKEEIMRNPNIRADLYSLIKEFITLKEILFLEDKLEKILISILAIQGIKKHVANKINEQVQISIRDEGIINQAINILSENLK